MFCSWCGNEVQGNFCSKCGWSVGSSAPTGQYSPPIQIHVTDLKNSVKNKWIALFLCLFLGVLGVHRFYVGKIGTGIIYLFTIGIFGIGWIIDGLCILCGSFTDKQGNFLR